MLCTDAAESLHFSIETLAKSTTVCGDGEIARNQVPSLGLRLGASDFTFKCKDPVYGSASLIVHLIVTSPSLRVLD